jgi:hypothetical protein
MWREHCYRDGFCPDETKADTRSKAFGRAADGLQAKGVIGVRANWVWLPSAAHSKQNTGAPQ